MIREPRASGFGDFHSTLSMFSYQVVAFGVGCVCSHLGARPSDADLGLDIDHEGQPSPIHVGGRLRTTGSATGRGDGDPCPHARRHESVSRSPPSLRPGEHTRRRLDRPAKASRCHGRVCRGLSIHSRGDRRRQMRGDDPCARRSRRTQSAKRGVPSVSDFTSSPLHDRIGLDLEGTGSHDSARTTSSRRGSPHLRCVGAGGRSLSLSRVQRGTGVLERLEEARVLNTPALAPVSEAEEKRAWVEPVAKQLDMVTAICDLYRFDASPLPPSCEARSG